MDNGRDVKVQVGGEESRSRYPEWSASKQQRYVEIALQGANYRCRNGMLYGEIPGFYGLDARAETWEKCEQKLVQSLKAWISERWQNDLPIPSIGGLTFGAIANVEEDKRERLNCLERQLESLKLEVYGRPVRMLSLAGPFRWLNQWYKAYWQLLVSVASLLIIGAAYAAYNVDPIESYREIGEKKRMAARYAKIGDQLLLNSAFKSAEEIYQSALALYPSDVNARNGLFKAQILKPEAGRNNYDIEIAKTKLTSAQEPHRRGLLSFLC